MTPIDVEIEKLAEKHLHNWDAEGRLHILDHMIAAMRELIPLIREESAKIADDDWRGCLEMAKLYAESDEASRMHRMDSHVGKRIAAAIREGK